MADLIRYGAETREIATVTPGSREITQFNPAETLTHVAKLEGIIAMARRLQDWPLLEQAIDAEIEEQRQYVGWWKTEGPGANHGGDRSKSADAHAWSEKRAKAEHGIDHVVVSRWDDWTDEEKVEAYRERLRLGPRRVAQLEPTPNRVTPNSGENEWF